MSRHLSPARGPRNGAANVIAGWDRPLQDFFLTVYAGDRPAQGKVRASWLSLASAELVAEQLSLLGLTTPASLVDELRRDRSANAGNRIVQHRFDGSPEVLAEG